MQTKVAAWNDGIRLVVCSAGAAFCLYGALNVFGVFPAVPAAVAWPDPALPPLRLARIVVPPENARKPSTPAQHAAATRRPQRGSPLLHEPAATRWTRPAPAATRPTPRRPDPAAQPTTATTVVAPVTVTVEQAAPQLPPTPAAPAAAPSLPAVPSSPPLGPLPQLQQLPQLPQLPGQ